MIYGDYNDAAASYKQVIDLEPDNANAIYNLGVVYVYLEDYTLAVEDFNRAIVLESPIEEGPQPNKDCGPDNAQPGAASKSAP